MRLRGHGVLIREDGVAGEFFAFWGWQFGVGGAGVDCGDDGEVVLEAVEVGFCCGEGAVEGVEEGGVEWAEGEFVD